MHFFALKKTITIEIMRKYFFGAFLLIWLAGCDSTEKQARRLLEQAETSYAGNDLFTAKKQIDSIRALYPKAYGAIRDGLQLMRRIEVTEQERNIAVCDSLLPIRLAAIDSLKKDFVLEKDTAYNETGTYVHRTQTVERNLQRCYLRSSVDEKGEMILASVYYGAKPLGHTSLRLSISDGTFAETPAIPYDGGSNYRFEDMGMTTEVVTYRPEQAKSAVRFVCTYPQERIKAEYKGGKPYILYLNDTDKKAICATFELASALNDVENMRRQTEKSRKKLAYLRKKLAKPDPE